MLPLIKAIDKFKNVRMSLALKAIELRSRERGHEIEKAGHFKQFQMQLIQFKDAF